MGANKNNLEKLQILSLASRLSAMFVGLLQSFFLFRLFSVHDYGVVQKAVAVGSALGIYQHLGLASGSTREIAASKDKNEVFKIFITALSIRYIITFPLAIGLFHYAEYIALDKYNNAALILPLKIYALTLIVQGVQSMLNSVLSGTKRFNALFTYQVAIAVASLVLYLPLVHFYGINGYFYAMFAHNFLGSVALAFIALGPLRENLALPNFREFKYFFRELFTISLSIYLVKIIYTLWERSGTLILGLTISPEAVAVFSAAFLFSKKIIHISDAITDVNLPYLSEKYVNNIAEFQKAFSDNFNKVFVLILFIGVSAVFWSKQLVLLFASSKYSDALPLILPFMFTFIFYSYLNIIKSSILVPAKLVTQMIATFVILIGFGIGSYYGFLAFTDFSHVSSMTLGLLVGSTLALLFAIYAIYLRLKFKIFTHDHYLLIFQAFLIGASQNAFNNNFLYKVILYLLYVLLAVIGINATKFFTVSQAFLVYKKILAKFQSQKVGN